MLTISTHGAIALVDDNDLDRMIMLRVLGMSHLVNTVVEFATAASFIETLRLQHEAGQIDFALVLMDINMPGMDGLEALGEISEVLESSGLPVVMLTGSQSRADAATAVERGARGFLVKQSGIDSYVAAINNEFANDLQKAPR